jgi:hypothetical protein
MERDIKRLESKVAKRREPVDRIVLGVTRVACNATRYALKTWLDISIYANRESLQNDGSAAE